MTALIAMLTDRAYVVAFFLAFAVLAWSERGAWRAFLWLATGTGIGWLSEFVSVHTGFPFGHYVYHQGNFGSEMWIGPVPLFASVSFAFMSYFAYSAACRLLAREGDEGAGARPAAVALLAAAIGTWMDTVIDPLTLLGEYWFLGDLYHYDPPGAHFGVPLVNYFGWMVTIGAIVMANQLLDRWQERRGARLARGPALPFASLWGIGCCTGVFVFMLAVNVYLLASGATPPDVPVGRILVSGAVSFALFALFVAVLTRRAPTGAKKPVRWAGRPV